MSVCVCVATCNLFKIFNAILKIHNKCTCTCTCICKAACKVLAYISWPTLYIHCTCTSVHAFTCNKIYLSSVCSLMVPYSTLIVISTSTSMLGKMKLLSSSIPPPPPSIVSPPSLLLASTPDPLEEGQSSSVEATLPPPPSPSNAPSSHGGGVGHGLTLGLVDDCGDSLGGNSPVISDLILL